MQGMGTRSLGWGIRGYSRVQKLARILDMTTATAEQRLHALQHWEKYGIQAAQDAIGVSRSTLYRWRKQFREAGSIVALNPRSRAPRRKRLRWNWPRPVRERILQLRCRHANLGKDKVHKFLHPWCEARGYPVPSASTIGRLIADHPSRVRVTSPATWTVAAGRSPGGANGGISSRKGSGLRTAGRWWGWIRLSCSARGGTGMC